MKLALGQYPGEGFYGGIRQMKNKKVIQILSCALLSAFLFTILSAPYAYSQGSPSSRKEGEGAGEPATKSLAGKKSEKERFLTFSQLKQQYLRNLEQLKTPNNEALTKQINAIKDIVENRLLFSAPLEQSGKRYVFGAYCGDQARVHFVIEYVEKSDSVQIYSSAGDSFRESIKSAAGTLRASPLSSLPEGQITGIANVLAQGIVGPNQEIQQVLTDQGINEEMTGIFTKAAGESESAGFAKLRDAVPSSLTIKEHQNRVKFQPNQEFVSPLIDKGREAQLPNQNINLNNNNVPFGLLPIWSVQRGLMMALAYENIFFQLVLMWIVPIIINLFTGYSLFLLISYSGVGSSVLFMLAHVKVYHNLHQPSQRPTMADRAKLLILGIFMSAAFACLAVLGVAFMSSASGWLYGTIAGVVCVLIGFFLALCIHYMWTVLNTQKSVTSRQNASGIEMSDSPTVNEQILIEKKIEIFLKLYPEMKNAFGEEWIIRNFQSLVQLAENTSAEDIKLLFCDNPPELGKLFSAEQLEALIPVLFDSDFAEEDNLTLLLAVKEWLIKEYGNETFKKNWPYFVQLLKGIPSGTISSVQYAYLTLKDILNISLNEVKDNNYEDKEFPVFKTVSKGVVFNYVMAQIGEQLGSVYDIESPILLEFLEMQLTVMNFKGVPNKERLLELFVTVYPEMENSFGQDWIRNNLGILSKLTESVGIVNAYHLFKTDMPKLRQNYTSEKFQQDWPNIFCNITNAIDPYEYIKGRSPSRIPAASDPRNTILKLPDDESDESSDEGVITPEQRSNKNENNNNNNNNNDKPFALLPMWSRLADVEGTDFVRKMPEILTLAETFGVVQMFQKLQGLSKVSPQLVTVEKAAEILRRNVEGMIVYPDRFIELLKHGLPMPEPVSDAVLEAGAEAFVRLHNVIPQKQESLRVLGRQLGKYGIGQGIKAHAKYNLSVQASRASGVVTHLSAKSMPQLAKRYSALKSEEEWKKLNKTEQNQVVNAVSARWKNIKIRVKGSKPIGMGVDLLLQREEMGLGFSAREGFYVELSGGALLTLSGIHKDQETLRKELEETLEKKISLIQWDVNTLTEIPGLEDAMDVMIGRIQSISVRIWESVSGEHLSTNETKQLNQKIGSILKESLSIMRKNAVVIDLRNNNKDIQARLRLAVEEYRVYHAAFLEDQAVLVLVGEEEVIKEFKQQTGISERDLFNVGTEPRDVMPGLTGYVVKVVTGKTEGWPETVLLKYLSDVSLLKTWEDLQDESESIREFLIQA